MPAEKIYSTKEVADILGYHPDTILKWIREGKITPVKWLNSRVCLVSQSALDDFVAFDKNKPE